MKTICLLLVMLTGCATALTKEGKTVRLLMKSDAPATCKEITAIKAGSLLMVDEQSRRNDLREKAYYVGADTVTWDRINEDNIVFGTAYKCIN